MKGITVKKIMRMIANGTMMLLALVLPFIAFGKWCVFENPSLIVLCIGWVIYFLVVGLALIGLHIIETSDWQSITSSPVFYSLMGVFVVGVFVVLPVWYLFFH
jgi:hypothetical protein